MHKGTNILETMRIQKKLKTYKIKIKNYIQ